MFRDVNMVFGIDGFINYEGLKIVFKAGIETIIKF
jgi:hypothetical protein